MKLLFCLKCHDVMGLIPQAWRTCYCGKSGGQYNEDNMTATIGGSAHVFAVANWFFGTRDGSVSPEQLAQWRATYSREEGQDCWWGEYDGDNQLMRLEDPNGPRLTIEIEEFDEINNKVIIIDEREFVMKAELFLDVNGKKFVVVPKNK